MEQTKTLLNELHKGLRAGLVGIKNIENKIENIELLKLIKSQEKRLNAKDKEIKKLCIDFDQKITDINMLMKAGSFISTNLETTLESGDKKIVELLTDGYTMGVTKMGELGVKFKEANKVAFVQISNLETMFNLFIEELSKFNK